MSYRNLKITPMLSAFLDLCGERLSSAQIKAEAQLLRKDIEQGITDQFHRAIEDSTFASKYAGIINLSPRAIGNHDYEHMFNALCSPGQGLILKGARREAGILWTPDKPPLSWRDHFQPLSVDANIPLSESFRFTRRDVARWDCAAAFVPDSKMRDLAWILDCGKDKVRCIVAADGGVVVIFRVDADDFESWQYECKRLRQWCADRELHFARFSMHTLVPISRESRGRGALLYLA